MRLWRPRTFRERAFSFIGAFVFAVSTTLGGISYLQYRGQFREEFIKRGKALATNLALSSELGVLRGEEQLLNTSARGVIYEQDVVVVFLYNVSGKLLLEKWSRTGERVTEPIVETIDRGVLLKISQDRQVIERSIPQGSRLLDLVGPIYSSQRPKIPEESISDLSESLAGPVDGQYVIGAARIVLSLDRVDQHLNSILRLWLLVIATFLAVGASMTYTLVRRLMVPLDGLIEQARQIAAGGLDQKIRIAYRDELGRLADLFNNIASGFKEAIVQQQEQVTMRLRLMERTQEVEAMNAQLRQANERIKEADRLKSEFLANMSHELRTPLNSIMGFAKVILKGIDGPITEAQERDLTTIYSSGSHLLALINDILDLSKIESGRMDLVMEQVNLGEMIHGVISTAKALVKDKPIHLVQEVPPDLPPIIADRTRIRQCLLNLISNAAKFTEKGSITIRASREDGAVLMTVKDTGIGIRPEDQGKIFHEFVQLDSSSTRKEGGTGLGLAITKKCVEMHGGTIWVESAAGQGSAFTLRLPVEQIQQSPVQPVPRSEAATSSEWGGAKETVLAVDDEPEALTLYRRVLEREGYKILTITEGEKVIPVARMVQPRAIILDILMPDKDGWEVLQELKSDPSTRNIPVVVCSVVTDRSRGIGLGAEAYLVKPIDDEELLGTLKQVAHVGDLQAGDTPEVA